MKKEDFNTILTRNIFEGNISGIINIVDKDKTYTFVLREVKFDGKNLVLEYERKN